MSHPPPGPPPAWYQDPRDASMLRYWDGARWTPFTAMTPGAAAAPKRGEHPRLTLAAALGALVVLAGSLVSSRFVLDALVDQGWPLYVYMLLSILMAYGPSVLWCVWAVKRWGTSTFRDDIGLKVRWVDTGWGPLTWIAAVMTQLGVTALVLGLGIPLIGNVEAIDDLDADRAYVISLLVAAVVAAPIVEEIVFRGVVLRGFLGVMPVTVALALQGLLFGAAHVDPIRGTGNIGLVIILSAVGIVFGVAAYLTRRLAAVMIAHAIFNGVVMAIVLTGAAATG